MSEPATEPIASGWAAYGKDWAVHGATKEEAVRLFHDREKVYADLDARAVARDERGTVTEELEEANRTQQGRELRAD